MQVCDDSITACNGLTACSLEPGLLFQRVVADLQELLSILAISTLQNDFSTICSTYVGSALSAIQAPENIKLCGGRIL